MDLALNNLQGLICHKTKQTNITVSVEPGVKIKETEKNGKYLDLSENKESCGTSEWLW